MSSGTYDFPPLPEDYRGVDQRLRDSRSQLARLANAKSLENAGEPTLLVLYEHLRLLSEFVNVIHELAEGHLPDSGSEVQRIIDQPLEGVRQDLLTYYWRRGCLLKQHASGHVANRLVVVMQEIRGDWSRLMVAARVYGQDLHNAAPAEDRLTSGNELLNALRNFADVLSLVVEALPS